jgi:hypothetical protein
MGCYFLPDALELLKGDETETERDVESRKSGYDLTFSQWVDLVWATRQGWPEESKALKTEGVSWVAWRGQSLRAAEVFVNAKLGIYR